MEIKEFTSQFKNHIVLFVGTGLSLRYCNGAYSWKDILEKAVTELTGNIEDFLTIIDRHFSHDIYDFPAIASEVENLFTNILEKDRNGKFKTTNDVYFQNVANRIKSSRFKIFLSELVKRQTIKEEMRSEIMSMKNMQKNICSIITTNYDNLIEQIFGFVPLVGNDILLSNPYGSVYKIHGTCEQPESIIMTTEDYHKFDSSYELIQSQLVSLFIHNPIVFLGYGMNDVNIKSLLKIIFKYVKQNSIEAEKIKKNFLVVEYDKGNSNTDVQEYDCTIDDNTVIRINRVKTDNFVKIYESISDLVIPISAMDVKKVRDILAEICEGTDGIKVYVTADMDRLQNHDKVLAIGSPQSITVNYMDSSEMIVNYFDIIASKDISRTYIIKKLKIQSSQFFPIYGFLSINKDIENANELKKIEENKIKQIKSNKNVSNYGHQEISQIEQDDNIPESKKDWAIIGGVVYGSIRLADLKEHLINYNGDRESTPYRRLIVVYDYYYFYIENNENRM